MTERLRIIEQIADLVAAHDADANPNPDVTARIVLTALEDAGWVPPSRVSELLRANNAEVVSRREAEYKLERACGFVTVADVRKVS